MAGEEYIAVVMVEFALTYFFFHLAFKLDEEHSSLKLYMIFAGILSMAVLANTGIEISEAATLAASITSMLTSFYYLTMFSLVVSFFVLGIYIFQTVLVSMIPKNPLRRKKKAVE